MTAFAITGARIFDGERFRPGTHLMVEGGQIAAIANDPPPAGVAAITLAGGILSPGFVDVQVNGGGGVLLNNEPTARAMKHIAAAHRDLGTTGILPTLITDTREKTRAVLDAAAGGKVGASDGVIGLHLEGPHLDPRRKGAHMAELMRPVDSDDMEAYVAAARRLGTLHITLAACQATPEQVHALTGAGVIVSIGHSEATAAEADALFNAGARGVTHLFNAMSGLGHREPGLVGAVLSRGDVWGGFIADGHHVDPRSLGIALAAKPGPGRLYLVSDAMALAGSNEQSFTLNGRTILRDTAGGAPRLTLADGTLAGADTDMAASVRFLVERVGVSPEDALRRATADPADFLRRHNQYGRLTPGARADLVHLDQRLGVVETWMAEQFE